MTDDPIKPEILEAARAAIAELERAAPQASENGAAEPFTLETALDAAPLRGLFIRFQIRTLEGSPWGLYDIRSGDGRTTIGSQFSMNSPASAEPGAAEHIARMLQRAGREIWRTPATSPDRIALIEAGRHASAPQGPDCEMYGRGTTWDSNFRHEVLYEEENFDRHRLKLRHCGHCGQIFAYRYSNAWTFLVRVSEEEAALIREDYDWADALIQSRRHYTERPPGWGGEGYWADGPEGELSARASNEDQ